MFLITTVIKNWLSISYQIDREPVQLMPIPALSVGDDEDDENGMDDDGPGTTEIQLGGLNTTDKRFRAYKGYIGCLSSEFFKILFFIYIRKSYFLDCNL